jgi:hypothetical protein
LKLLELTRGFISGGTRCFGHHGTDLVPSAVIQHPFRSRFPQQTICLFHFLKTTSGQALVPSTSPSPSALFQTSFAAAGSAQIEPVTVLLIGIHDLNWIARTQ